jgi:hypothetical protein
VHLRAGGERRPLRGLRAPPMARRSRADLLIGGRLGQIADIRDIFVLDLAEGSREE